jgi:DNA modification methylase
MWQHELCVYGWKQGHQPKVKPPANATTVWDFNQQGEEDTEHPTQKPSGLMVRALEHQTTVDDLCYEPFSGSGTMIAAAERTARRCYGVELEPRFVAVALERLAGMGLTPRLADG